MVLATTDVLGTVRDALTTLSKWPVSVAGLAINCWSL